MYEVIVIGGGVIGLTVAWELSGRGLDVAVLDAGLLGQESSWAGAGILAPGNPRLAKSPDARLRAASTALWPQISERLRSETGQDNGFRLCGGLEICPAGDARTLDEDIAGWQDEGVGVERVTPADMSALEPRLSRDFSSAYRLPGMGQVRNPRHLKALIAACAQKGVTLRPGVPVWSIDRSGDRIESVRTSEGALKAGQFVVCSGAWTGRLLAEVGCSVPIHPVRGQIVLLNAVPLPVRHVVNVGPRYLVPRPDGRVLIGATEELAGFEKRNTAEAVAGLIEFGTALCPDLKRATLERTWAGLRPGSADGRPFLGRVPGQENLFVAAGHFRAGLHLSPITGVVLSQLLCGEEPSVPLETYAVDRA